MYHGACLKYEKEMNKYYFIVKRSLLKAFLAMVMIAIFAFAAFAVKSDSKRINFKNRFIIGIYSAIYPQVVKECKEADFNCVQTYEQNDIYLKQYINEANKLGLYAMIYPLVDYAKYNAENKLAIIDFVRKNNCANVIWYLADEPDLSNDSSANNKLSELKEVVKIAAPDSTTALIVSTPAKFKDYINYVDVFMFDVYPIGMPCKGDYGVKNVAINAHKAIEAAGNKYPVWAVLQAFGYQNEKNHGWGWKREPTYKEERAMTYLAIINGAKGVFYYTYGSPGYHIVNSPQHWADVKSIVAELNVLTPVILSPIERSIKLDDGNNNRSIEFTARYYRNKTFLFAVNTEEEPVKAKIIGGFENCKVYGGDKINVKNGRIEDVFLPLETKIYVCD